MGTRMMWAKIADYFDLQRGAVFGFGTHGDDDMGHMEMMIWDTWR